jgi:hypothetical protein
MTGASASATCGGRRGRQAVPRHVIPLETALEGVELAAEEGLLTDQQIYTHCANLLNGLGAGTSRREGGLRAIGRRGGLLSRGGLRRPRAATSGGACATRDGCGPGSACGRAPTATTRAPDAGSVRVQPQDTTTASIRSRVHLATMHRMLKAPHDAVAHASSNQVGGAGRSQPRGRGGHGLIGCRDRRTAME